jgi:predicted dehydrogenase
MQLGQLRVGMIGCGVNAEDHVRSMREAGLEIAAVCGTVDSPRVADFAKRHEIPLVFNGADELLNARKEWDALALITPPNITLEILEKALPIGVPMFVEKPVAFRSERIKPLLGRNLPVIVGYNRRYYRPVREAREEANRMPPAITRIEFPQATAFTDKLYDRPDYLRGYFSSVAVLGLDLTRFVLGDLKLEHAQRLVNGDDQLLGIAATLTTGSGGVVQFLANFDGSANFSFTMDWSNHRYELKPFEKGTVYDGLEMVQATIEKPLRSFTPKVTREIWLEDVDYKFKPGYVAEALALKSLLQGEDPGNATRLEDAYAASKLAEDLAGRVFTE